MTGHLLPTDADWTDDNAMIADLSSVNAEIARYVLRYLDADAERAEPINSNDEHAFGQRIIDIGKRVQHRAGRRLGQTGNAPVVEGEAMSSRARELERAPDRDQGP